MNPLSKKLSVMILTILVSTPVLTTSADAKSNLKSSSGQIVGSLDAKFFDVHKQKSKFKPKKYVLADWPNDWKWDRDIDPDKSLFNQLDANTNGAITKKEFRARVMNDREDEVFAALDKNKDKKINRSELARFSKN